MHICRMHSFHIGQEHLLHCQFELASEAKQLLMSISTNAQMMGLCPETIHGGTDALKDQLTC